MHKCFPSYQFPLLMPRGYHKSTSCQSLHQILKVQYCSLGKPMRDVKLWCFGLGKNLLNARTTANSGMSIILGWTIALNRYWSGEDWDVLQKWSLHSCCAGITVIITQWHLLDFVSMATFIIHKECMASVYKLTFFIWRQIANKVDQGTAGASVWVISTFYWST